MQRHPSFPCFQTSRCVPRFPPKRSFRQLSLLYPPPQPTSHLAVPPSLSNTFGSLCNGENGRFSFVEVKPSSLPPDLLSSIFLEYSQVTELWATCFFFERSCWSCALLRAPSDDGASGWKTMFPFPSCCFFWILPLPLQCLLPGSQRSGIVFKSVMRFVVRFPVSYDERPVFSSHILTSPIPALSPPYLFSVLGG